MHNHQTRIKAVTIFLALAFLASLGLASPHQSEATETKEKAVAKQEVKINKIKKNAKKQTKAAEVQKAEETKTPEVKPEPPKPAPPPPPPVTPDKKKYASPNGYQKMTDGSEVNFCSMGVIYMHGYKYSYYSSRVLYHYRTPEWYACDDHLYRTKEGYIVVASRDHAQGTIVPTPFGPGQVWDRCQRSGVIDIYVNF